MHGQLSTDDDAKRQIDGLVACFFGLFSNAGGAEPHLQRIRDLFIPEGIISKCVAIPPEVYTLEQFIEPRQLLLSGGRLQEFQEVETSERTLVVGRVAQRVCSYRKSGILDGVPFSTRGVKVFQFIEGADGWKISSVAWDDERNGFTLDERLIPASDGALSFRPE